MGEPGKDESQGRRILERAERESEGLIGRMVRHFTAAEADPSDWAELWGRRIGRLLSLIGVIVLAYWLFLKIAPQ